MLTSKMECGKNIKLFNVELDENTLIIWRLNAIVVWLYISVRIMKHKNHHLNKMLIGHKCTWYKLTKNKTYT